MTRLLYHHKHETWLENYNIIIYDSIDSTHLEAQRLLLSNKIKHNTVICADRQTQGIGRKYNNQWSSPIGGLYMSILYHDKYDIEFIKDLPHNIIMSVIATIKNYIPDNLHDNIRFKAPNDVFYNEQKISGVLIDSSISGQYASNIIVSIGINIDVSPQILNTSYQSISLKDITDHTFNISDIVEYLMSQIHNTIDSTSPIA